MKRLLCCLLLLTLCLTLFAGCKSDEEEIPRGYLMATCAGAPYRLYIPSTWSSTVEYGVSGGTYNLLTTSIVRMQIYERASGTEVADFYKGSIHSAIEAVGIDLATVEEPSVVLLGGLDGSRYHESASVSGKKLHFVTYIGAASEAFYVLTFTMDDSILDALRDNMNGIVENFKLAEPYGGSKKDFVRTINDTVSAPAGMKLASSDDSSYRFFVPSDWEFDKTVSITEAHTKTRDANLSVVSYLPNEAMTVSDFLDKQNGQLITAYGDGYEKLGEGEATLGSRAAKTVEYKIVTEGKTYRVKLWAVGLYENILYGNVIYSLTYTALEETYDLYLTDAGLAVSAFAFR